MPDVVQKLWGFCNTLRHDGINYGVWYDDAQFSRTAILHAKAAAKLNGLSYSRLMAGAARTLENAGAEGLVICANTMHRLADDILREVRIPLIHIADAAAAAL